MYIIIHVQKVEWKKCIRPNYRTMHLDFTNLLGKVLFCFISTNRSTKNIIKKDQQRTYVMSDVYVFFFLLIFFYKSICYGYSEFELHWQVDAIQMCTHNIWLYKVDKKYMICNLKTTELLDCAFIGVCAVIRSNTLLLNQIKWICSRPSPLCSTIGISLWADTDGRVLIWLHVNEGPLYPYST